LAYCLKCGTPIPINAAFCPSCGTPTQAQSSPYSAGAHSPTPDSGLTDLTRNSAAQQYWMKRLLAYVVDAIVVYALIGIVTAVAALPSFLAGVFVPGYSPRIFPFGGFFGTFAGLLFVLYFTCAEATYGKTLGKRVMGLRVTVEGGGKPSLGVSFIRNISKINWVLLLLDVILGLALEAGYTRKFSDRYLGTNVTTA
jgi:uncharacterized RDD family membrane protein YckC